MIAVRFETIVPILETNLSREMKSKSFVET